MSYYRRIFRGAAASVWATANKILWLKELGIETDTLRAKIGDDATAWNSLPYWNAVNSVSFEATGDQTANTHVISASVTIVGLSNWVWPILVTGEGTPELRVNGGPWRTEAIIRNGDAVELRLITSSSPSTARVATLRLPGSTADWSVTTAP